MMNEPVRTPKELEINKSAKDKEEHPNQAYPTLSFVLLNLSFIASQRDTFISFRRLSGKSLFAVRSDGFVGSDLF